MFYEYDWQEEWLFSNMYPVISMIINTQSEKTKCISRQQGRNCPLDNKDADLDTFCEAYKQGDGYICNAAAKDDPVEDTVL